MTLFIYFFKRIRAQIVRGAILTYLQKKNKNPMQKRIYICHLLKLEMSIYILFKSNAIIFG